MPAGLLDSAAAVPAAGGDAATEHEDSSTAEVVEQQQQQPVLRIAPKLVAPAELAWLASAPLRLLAGHSPSAQLQQLLGWSFQQVLRRSVVVAQLMELGKMYPAGQVRCRACYCTVIDCTACCSCAALVGSGKCRRCSSAGQVRRRAFIAQVGLHC
jgi:hypothetical protein